MDIKKKQSPGEKLQDSQILDLRLDYVGTAIFLFYYYSCRSYSKYTHLVSSFYILVSG